MILSSPHVHTQFCDGRSTAQEQVRSALAHGFQSLGFSSHARQCFHPGACMTPENEQAYIAEIRRLQATYAGQIRIWLGTELDLYACADTAPYDYFIGSVHYLPAKDGFCAVDGDGAALRRFVEAEYAGDGVAMACDYYRSYAALMRCRRPLIGGHFDLVRKNNGQYHLFDESDPRYRAAALDALRAARECGVVLEVNTGGMAFPSSVGCITYVIICRKSPLVNYPHQKRSLSSPCPPTGYTIRQGQTIHLILLPA